MTKRTDENMGGSICDPTNNGLLSIIIFKSFIFMSRKYWNSNNSRPTTLIIIE